MRTHRLSCMKKRSSVVRVMNWIALVFVCVVCVATFLYTKILAASSDVAISQVYGGGGNSGATYKNDFIELFNRSSAAVSLSGWSVQYASATGSTWQVTMLSGTIEAGHYYLIQEAAGSGGTADLPTPEATGGIAMSGSAGKVALVNGSSALSGSCPKGTSILDFVGFGSTANCYEGAAPTAAPSNTNSIFRGAGGCVDADNNSTDFIVGVAAPRNGASPPHYCVGSTNPSGMTAAMPASIPIGGTSLLTVTVVPGANPSSTAITVTGNLLALGGSASQPFFDDGSHGDVTAGDLTFSFQVTAAAGTAPGTKNLAVIIADAEARTASLNLALTIEAPYLAVHDIQGSGSVSPHAGEYVTTRGIVTALKNNGFFIQTPDAEIDGDPNTSEGIFVYTSSSPPTAAAIGNLVSVTGTIQEYIPASDPASPSMTQLSGSPAVNLISTGNSLPAPIILTPADTDPSGGLVQLERFEGMRVHVDSLTVISPTQGYIDEIEATASTTGVFYGVITGVARPFREPGIEIPDPLPVGAPCCIPRFDGNPERLRVDSDVQPGAAPLEVAAGAVITNLTGPLDYFGRSYSILPDPDPPPSVTNVLTAVPLPLVSSDEFTIASFNLKRFFDTQDNPLLSEPVLTPPAFRNRLQKVSLTVRDILRSPDILGVQEVENLATLEAIADQINSDTVAAGLDNPGYQALLMEGNDIGGINVGALVKSSRLGVDEFAQLGKDATYINPMTGTPELLNDRPPLLIRAKVNRPDASPFPVTVLVNHLRSFSNINDPLEGDRVRAKRRAQAEYLANLIQDRQLANRNEHLVVLGDFNSYPFNDGYVDVLGAIRGTPTPADQVLLASPDLVNPDLVALLDRLPPAERYSFVFDGNAQALDHILVSDNLLPHVTQFLYARSNADFPESLHNDPTRPERASDHDIPVLALIFRPPAGYEADVAPRPTGDGTVTLTDWIQVGRFAAGLDTPESPDEFKRTDCAPKETLGDGRISLLDWVQAGRYAAGLDALALAGGPSTSSLKRMKGELNVESAQPIPRPHSTIRLVPITPDVTAPVVVEVQLDSRGDENAVGFSVAYDPAVFEPPEVKPGPDARETMLHVNSRY